MSDGGFAFGVGTDDYTFGQRQGDAHVDLAVVQDIGFELDAIGGLVEVLQQLGLVDADPTQQGQHDAVGVAGKVGQDDLQVKTVLKRQTGGGCATDLAVVDEDQQPVGIVLEVCDGGQQVSA